MSTIETDVLAANQAFYMAFNQRNVVAKEALWADREDIACIHPGWGALRGKEHVFGSWGAILGSLESPQIIGTNETVHVTGTTAFVLCDEAVDGEVPQLVATNIFVQIEGTWKLMHHHASPIIQVLESEDTDGHEELDPEDFSSDIMH